MTLDFNKMTREQLAQHFAARIGNLDNELLALSQIIVAEEALGVTRDAFKKHSMLKWAHEIASGALHPRAVFVFAGKDGAVRAMIGLSAKEQVRLADGGTVSVVRIDGKVADKFKLRIEQLTDVELRQVFHDGKVRSLAQQTPVAQTRIARVVENEQTVREEFVPNTKNGTVQFWGRNPVIPRKTLIRALNSITPRPERKRPTVKSMKAVDERRFAN